MAERSYSIYNVLELVRRRPGMFVDEVTLKGIRTLTCGYEMAMRDANVQNGSSPAFHEFHEYVREIYGYRESTAGWPNMILAVILGLNPKTISWEKYDSGVTENQHKDSIEEFYRLLDNFRGTYA